MRNGRYRVYMLREMTSLLVGFYTFLTIFALAALSADSPDQWNGFLASQQSPVIATLHGFALLYFLFYQTFPWFRLAPKAMPVQIAGKKLPGSYIVLGHYVTWAAISAFIFWVVGVI